MCPTVRVYIPAVEENPFIVTKIMRPSDPGKHGEVALQVLKEVETDPFI